jgi:hypothetical protein
MQPTAGDGSEERCKTAKLRQAASNSIPQPRIECARSVLADQVQEPLGQGVCSSSVRTELQQ